MAEEGMTAAEARVLVDFAVLAGPRNPEWLAGFLTPAGPIVVSGDGPLPEGDYNGNGDPVMVTDSAIDAINWLVAVDGGRTRGDANRLAQGFTALVASRLAWGKDPSRQNAEAMASAISAVIDAIDDEIPEEDSEDPEAIARFAEDYRGNGGDGSEDDRVLAEDVANSGCACDFPRDGVYCYACEAKMALGFTLPEPEGT